jgi:hypothetical protein
VDAVSIAARPCFLCDENRPAEQGSIISGDYKILVNPYPLFDQHFTIVHRQHRKQAIKDAFKDLLDMSRSFGEKYFVLYNGPECGASAPDHLHFQAGLSSCLPISAEIHAAHFKSAARFRLDGSTALSFPDDGIRRYILLEGTSKKTLREIFRQLYETYKVFADAPNEPLMNILVFFNAAGKKFSILIFPRSKHRPSLYFKHDPDKFLFSPASADLGGLCILPRREDFGRATATLLKNCIGEVMLSEDTFRDLFNTVSTVI